MDEKLHPTESNGCNFLSMLVKNSPSKTLVYLVQLLHTRWEVTAWICNQGDLVIIRNHYTEKEIPHGTALVFTRDCEDKLQHRQQISRLSPWWLFCCCAMEWPFASIVQNFCKHYGDFLMGTVASQITSLTIVYSTIYSGAGQRKHQSSASLAFVRGIHRRPVNSLHKWPATRKMFPFHDASSKSCC